MYPNLYIFGTRIPTYVALASLGLIISIYFVNILLLKKHLVLKYSVNVAMALPGIIIGGKLFGIISTELRDIQLGEQSAFQNIWYKSGIVYYGGLLGYILTAYIICKVKQQDFKELSNILVIGIPLFHCFGRIGCFFAGCCYGVESTSWIAFPYYINDSIELTSRVPVQLIEATFEFCLFVLLLMLYIHGERKADIQNINLLTLYLLIYSIFRFIIEIWRGDSIRGKFGLISFSQIISILIIATLMVTRMISKKGRGKTWL